MPYLYNAHSKPLHHAHGNSGTTPLVTPSAIPLSAEKLKTDQLKSVRNEVGQLHGKASLVALGFLAGAVAMYFYGK